jgi:hypothetical protein
VHERRRELRRLAYENLQRRFVDAPQSSGEEGPSRYRTDRATRRNALSREIG